jgi:hypothetical protein
MGGPLDCTLAGNQRKSLLPGAVRGDVVSAAAHLLPVTPTLLLPRSGFVQ